jgi:hypothetical protein
MHAFADSRAADKAVAEAQTRAANNDFVGAAAKYREAFKADPRPELMCNVGVAYYKAKDLPKAQRYLDHCLSIGTSLDRAFIDNVKKVLAQVESTLAAGNFTPVEILVQPSTATTTVAGGVPFDEPILGSHRMWFPFGKYKLTVHAEGHVDAVIDVDAKDRTAVPARVALETAPVVEVGSAQGSQGSADTGSAGSNSAGSGSALVEQSPAGAKPSLLPPIIASVASVGAGVIGLGFFRAARQRAEEAGEATDETAYNKLVEQARSRQHISWVVGGLAGAGAIVSGILWYRYASAPRVEIQASGNGAAISLSGRW